MIRNVLLVLFIAIQASGVSAMPLTVGKFGTALYVWTAGFRPGYSKVWRLQINLAPSATESGVLDFLGERLIPASTTTAGFFTAYNSPSEVLRNGDEESPPVFMAEHGDTPAYMGGNHRINGYDTVSTYTLNIKLDGASLTADGWYSGNELVLQEQYGINQGQAADFPILAWVRNTWKFNGSDFCRFEHRLTAAKPIDLSWWGGIQIQKPTVLTGRTMTLRVPGSVTYGSAAGVDVTVSPDAFTVDATDWADAGKPPEGFETTVFQSGAPQFTFAMSYDSGMYRGAMGTAFMQSAFGKMYPRGVDFPSPLEMRSGQSVSVSGHFGTYNGR